METEFVDTIYEGYKINKLGQVWSNKNNKLLKININKTKSKFGYKYVGLSINGIPFPIDIHRLLALTFIPNPNNLPQVDHIDRNKLNNKLSNLRWVSKKENMNNRTMILYPKGCIWLKRITKHGEYYCAEFTYNKIKTRKHGYDKDELQNWIDENKLKNKSAIIIQRFFKKYLSLSKSF